ncbi:putative F-box/FBD/LRR-repeat protein [Senna tora]|uniref:Putative F-box/FBD/LRR-repeat protein n=1 Tax=Senna tora TaxID=362788 RepID=A0A834TSQ7_9FABA|nr:putative F-box/FBD/LRR-repeat protein [Senna tora]
MDELKYSKTQKIDHRDASIDRLSNLPEGLLFKILSYIPFREVVFTSLLSNTWRSLYRSRPSLRFVDSIDTPYVRSSQFLEDDDLITSCSNPPEATRMVEIFDVTLRSPNAVSLNGFTCSTILVLRLNRVILSDSDFICLPSLKILHLKSVKFGSRETITKLFEGSIMMNLEDLALSDISYFGEQDVISLCCYSQGFPKLTRANIDTDIFIPLDALPNLESLRICPKLGGLLTSWIDPKHVHECLSSNLRTCYLEGFDSSDEELACVLPFAKYVVENGRVLETMTISCTNNPFAKNLINKELRLWQRSSSACQVNVGAGPSLRLPLEKINTEEAMSDRISKLSDDLLCKILSYLPNTKDAAATSILSKRWKSLWLQLPPLDFDKECCSHNVSVFVGTELESNYTSNFAELADGVLSVRRGGVVEQPTQRFRLKCQITDTHPSDIIRWTNTTILQRGAKALGLHLDLDLHLSLAFRFRTSLRPTNDVFHCSTIMVLNLIIKDKIDSVCLPSLKIMHFNGVEFSSGSDCVAKFRPGLTSIYY